VAAGSNFAEIAENAYAMLNGHNWRAHIGRRVGPDRVDDVIHSAMVDFIQALQREQIRDPERLRGFICRIVQRRIVRCYEDRIVSGIPHGHYQGCRYGPKDSDIHRIDALRKFDLRDPGPTPERLVIKRENESAISDKATQALAGLSERDREPLQRFYIEGHSWSLVRREMGLTQKQFYNLKQRAKLKAKAALEAKC
jgi:DNA-directed RNA polymerase specialized sigma24 family protein